LLRKTKHSEQKKLFYRDLNQGRNLAPLPSESRFLPAVAAAKIRAIVPAGKPLNAIAKLFNVDQSTIRRLARLQARYRGGERRQRKISPLY
jgi:hypothetical protein